MKTILLFVLLILLFPIISSAQHETDNWYFGSHAGMTFRNGAPTDISDGKLNSFEGCATLSDKTTGQLLFYTNGDTVWNRNHQIMNNGIGLLGGISSTQSVLIVPNPGDNEQYYVFTVPDLTGGKSPQDKNYTTKMHYSLVSLQDPDGAVMYKNVPLIDEVSEKLTGTLDCSGEGFWVLAHAKSKNEIYSFHVTVYGVVTQPVTSVYFESRRTHTASYMKLSPDRSKLAIASYYSDSFLGLLDFNSQTGEATNYKYLGTPNSSERFYGVSFSPDNTKLYAGAQVVVNSKEGESNLFQYEVNSYIDAVNATLVKIPVSNNSVLQLGIDGKIYIASGDSTYLEVIEKPNLKGSACGYRTKAVKLSRQPRFGLPNFMDYYFGIPTTKVVMCSTIDSIEIGLEPIESSSYSWTPTSGLSNPTIANPIASPLQTTEYTLTMRNSGGCVTMQTYLVNVVKKPTIGPIDPLCAGESARLSASGGDTYTWFPATGLDSATIANPIATPKVTTRYKVIVSKEGCVDSAFIDVNVIQVVANAGKDTTICQRVGIAQLGALPEANNSYTWYPATGLNDPYSANPLASPSSTTKYKLIVSNGNCKDSAFVTVNVIPFSGANAGTDKTICPNSSAQLGDKPEAGNTYTWLPTTDLDNPSIANPNASPKTTTQYILTVTSEHGCIAYDTVLVTVGNIVAKVSNDTTICSGTSVQLLATGGAKYTWSPSTGLSDTTIENPIATLTKTTTYKVKVSSGTCEDSAFVTITVNPQPTAKAGQDKTLCIGASTEIGEAAQAGFMYKWQPTAGLDDANKANPTATPTSTTQYTLTVTGKGGCTASDTVLVTIGTIKAIVSNDTSICEGASVKLFASGGAKYEWSPSTGLDNTLIENPTANPINTTRYKVLVSSGTCIDSAFVTVSILPPPNANAGNDTALCVGASTQIGIPAEAGNSYSWSPSSGLTSPFTSQTSASPATTTTYTLQVTNPAGCVKSDEVIVTVNPRNARSFTLQPDMVTILPGKQFTANLEIPSGVNDWSVQLKYDSLLVKYNSITGAQAIPDDKTGELLVSGNGGSRSIPIIFDAFLPHTSDTIYPVTLSVDASKVADCETWNATGNILMLADYCGKNIRVVSSTGKKYFLTVKDRNIDFGVGLSGNVRLEVFDYVGNSVLVVSDGALEAGEYSAGLDLPVGVYYCRMRAGMYESVGKVLIAR